MLSRKLGTWKYRRPFLIQGLQKTYKVYPASFNADADNALRSELICNSPVFLEFDCVLPKRFLSINGVQVHRSRRIRYVRNMDTLQREERTAIISDACDSIDKNFPYQPWHWFLDADKLGRFLGEIGGNRRKYLDSVLDDVGFPITGAHGDFGGTNVLIDHSGKKHLIDWDDCNPDGSFSHDALQAFLRMHFPNQPERNRKDWRSLRLDSLARLEKDNLQDLSKILDTSTDALVCWHLVLHGTISFNHKVSKKRRRERLGMLCEFLDERSKGSRLYSSVDR